MLDKQEQFTIEVQISQFNKLIEAIAESLNKELINRIHDTSPVSQFMNKQETCTYLNISNNTLDDWIKKGLPAIKIGRVVRFQKSDIDSWLQNYRSSK